MIGYRRSWWATGACGVLAHKGVTGSGWWSQQVVPEGVSYPPCLEGVSYPPCLEEGGGHTEEDGGCYGGELVVGLQQFLLQEGACLVEELHWARGRKVSVFGHVHCEYFILTLSPILTHLPPGHASKGSG